MKIKMRIGKKTLNKTVFNNRKLSSFTIASIILLTSLTAAIIFIPSIAKAEGEETVNLLPNADGTTQQWTPSKDAMHWSLVCDPVGEPDEDSTYVYTSSINKYEEFNHEDLDLPEGATITNVRVNARLKNNFCQEVNIGIKIRDTRYPGATDTDMTSSYADYYQDWATNPATGCAWTKEDIDNLQSSLESLAVVGSKTICTQIYITVTYTPSTTLAAVVDWGSPNKINGASYVISANESTGDIRSYRWNLGNGTIIAGGEYSWIRVNYRLAGIYTINLTITDEEENNAYAEEVVTIKQYISVVKNSNNNGVNYVTWGANNSIMASKLATDLGLAAGDFIEKFNPDSGEWDIKYDVSYSGDFKISRWDHIMIDLQTSSQASHSFTPSIGPETPHDVSMNFTSNNQGYIYITWSEDYVITPANFINALETKGQIVNGDDISIYVYNPTTNIWASYNPNIPEVFNSLTSIQPYDVICFHASPRHNIIRYKPSDW